jgi:hypothetical protein
MKKILALIAVFLVFSSCGKLDDLNKNTKDASETPGETLFTSAQKNLFDQMVNSNVNNNIFRLIDQYWTETTYTDESNYDLITRTIPDNHWDIFYRTILKNLVESAKVLNSTPLPPSGPETAATKQNKLAMVEILTVYSWSVMVETFGDIPYSEAFDVNNTSPAYDDATTIYKDLIKRLSAAISNLDQSQPSTFEKADNMYHGDVTSWYKFANSLKLKMGMIISDADAAYAKTVVEAAAPNVFKSNADNAKVVYLSAQPNANPIYVDLVASARHDFVPTSIIVDLMNSLDDPRLPAYFTTVDTSTELGVIKLAYVGGVNGASNDFTAYSHVADAIQEPTFEGTILDYPEVEFFLAEAVERGFSIGGNAQEHYDKAITASLKYWGEVPDSTITKYLAKPDVAYSTASGNYKEKIGRQKWLALYNRGFEAWTEWRRFDYPLLVAPPDNQTNGIVPVRLTYPISEQTLNGASYRAASAKIGGDEVGTKLFFDKY